MKKIIICLAFLPLVTACTVHRLDIQQGNVVTTDMVDKLKQGMNKKQVLFVLGSPLLEDPFHHDRWDYYYSYKPDGELRDRYRLTVHFEDDKLARIEPSGDIPSKEPLEMKRLSRDLF